MVEGVPFYRVLNGGGTLNVRNQRRGIAFAVCLRLRRLVIINKAEYQHGGCGRNQNKDKHIFCCLVGGRAFFHSFLPPFSIIMLTAFRALRKTEMQHIHAIRRLMPYIKCDVKHINRPHRTLQACSWALRGGCRHALQGLWV